MSGTTESLKIFHVVQEIPTVCAYFFEKEKRTEQTGLNLKKKGMEQE